MIFWGKLSLSPGMIGPELHLQAHVPATLERSARFLNFLRQYSYKLLNVVLLRLIVNKVTFVELHSHYWSFLYVCISRVVSYEKLKHNQRIFFNQPQQVFFFSI